MKHEISKIYQYFLIVFNKTIIPLALAAYEMITANEARAISVSSHIQPALVE